MMKEFYRVLEEDIESNNFDDALNKSVPVLRKLINVARNEVLPNFRDQLVRKIADEIILNYENTLSYVEGSLESLRYVPAIYSYGEKERLVRLVASSINELFSFIMGALLVIAELRSTLSGGENPPPGVV